MADSSLTRIRKRFAQGLSYSGIALPTTHCSAPLYSPPHKTKRTPSFFLRRSLVSSIRLALAILSQVASSEALEPTFTHVLRSGKFLEARGWSIGEALCHLLVLCDVVTARHEHDERRGWRVRGRKSLSNESFSAATSTSRDSRGCKNELLLSQGAMHARRAVGSPGPPWGE